MLLASIGSSIPTTSVRQRLHLMESNVGYPEFIIHYLSHPEGTDKVVRKHANRTAVHILLGKLSNS